MKSTHQIRFVSKPSPVTSPSGAKPSSPMVRGRETPTTKTVAKIYPSKRT